MPAMIIDSIKITTDLLDLTEEEATRYIGYVRARVTNPVSEIFIKDSGDGTVEVSYEAKSEPFERIRRITGYLVGTMGRWNDAKQAEENERVKHGMED